jgi:hypothetical protein
MNMAWTISMGMAYIMDIQQVYMDMPHGHAEEKQHGHAACRHRNAAWTWSITQYGHAAWTHGQAPLPWKCSMEMDMKHRHGHAV